MFYPDHSTIDGSLLKAYTNKMRALVHIENLNAGDECTYPAVMCGSTGICVHISKWCDGIGDCPDKIDEIQALCSS